MHPESSDVAGPVQEPQQVVETPRFDGATFDQERDGARLASQHNRILALMRDGVWRSLAEIAQRTGDPEASVSARLRDLRKDKWGAHGVDRQYVARGQWTYRVRLNRKDLFE